ncbi:hypothetical protein KC19_6G160900 [Ceratodon purpureus]|uniref:Uncharacterized protein n=1 Tax=Ceratodon purpureus TaxID=3225 RepID=A0A8T0HIE9_CERPU|nr:hypothetical protein KC19_6G160900 [Ceratodon purpureus]
MELGDGQDDATRYGRTSPCIFCRESYASPSLGEVYVWMPTALLLLEYCYVMIPLFLFPLRWMIVASCEPRFTTVKTD